MRYTESVCVKYRHIFYLDSYICICLFVYSLMYLSLFKFYKYGNVNLFYKFVPIGDIVVVVVVR